MNRKKIIDTWLHCCNVSKIEDLTDEQVVYLYAELADERTQFSVIDVFNERSEDDARKFADVVRECIITEQTISVYSVMIEGDVNETDELSKYRCEYRVES